ncbi:unnamed protein product [Discula destructiva]
MSARITAAQSTGSVAATTATAATASQAPISEYAEFFMGGIWEWTPAGVERVGRFLEDLNVDRPTYRFQEYSNVWLVRCPRQSELYIRRNFVQLLAKIEVEYLAALEAAALQLVQHDGSLADRVALHPDVRLPVSLPRTPDLPKDQGAGHASSHLPLGGSRPNVRPTVSLVVPDELVDAKNIVVWQELQAKNKDFEGTVFVTPAGRAALESAHEVQIVVDIAQKVVFIGATSLDNATHVKESLTQLLQDHYNLPNLPRISHHIFFVESATPYTIDAREVTWLNPVLARSTILDPWRFAGLEQYTLFENYAGVHDAGVFALRVCLFEPVKYGVLNKWWSLFGPYAQNVFNGRRPRRSSGFFEGLRAARRVRTVQEPAGAGSVSNWLEELAPATLAATTLPRVEMSGPGTPIHRGGEDEPVPLNFDPSRRNDVATVARGPSALSVGSGSVEVKHQMANLLDQQDAVLQDPSSTMQRAMKPSQRRISVPDPELMHSTALLRTSVGQPDHSANGTNMGIVDQELGGLVYSLGSLMECMRRRYGVVKLRADLGRFYAHTMPMTARAVNEENEPAEGWVPNDLRPRLEVHPGMLFTKALSSWGNDADFLGSGVWQPKTRAMFFDFRFEVMVGQTALDAVLEVNADDYTWKMRFLKNEVDVIYVHCLAQSWDFQMSLTHDPQLELEFDWATFADALVKSIDLKPSGLEFQHKFDGDLAGRPGSSIVINDVRARQVCRFLHQNRKTYLDISRILPTEIEPSRDSKYLTARKVLMNATAENPSAGDNPLTGEFAQWFEASVSSVRLEELLKQNQVLLPGEQVAWTVRQLEQEGLFADLYLQAAEVVKGMDGVGVECNNGHEMRRKQAGESYIW